MDPRRARWPLALALVALAGAAPAAAQEDQPHVRVAFEVSPTEAAPGATVTVRARVEVDEGWHVYDPSETQGVPTTLSVTLPPGAALVGDVQTPPFQQEEMEYVGLLRVQRGAFTFSQRVRLGPDAAGPVILPVALEYQACSEGEGAVCLPPETAEGSLTVAVKEAPPREPFGLAGADFGAGGPDPVSVRFEVEPAAAARGQTVTVRAHVTVAPGWHVYDPTETQGVPTQLEVTAPAWLIPLGGVAAPPAEELPGPEGPLRVHGGAVTFTRALRVAPDAAPGERTALAVALTAQPCSEDGRCLLAATTRGTLDLLVTDAPPVVSAALATPGAGPWPAPGGAGPAGTGLGVGELVAASVVAGLLMLLMPCTYPMIPITVSIFSKGKELPRGQTVARAAIYAAGIVISFVLVGGVVQVLAGARGQGAVSTIATNAWVNLAIGVAFVYFAFSFFGYYEIGMPQFLYRLMQGSAGRPGGDGTIPAWSLFLMGLFFVLTSYTCGAPVVLGMFALAAGAPHPLAVVGATFVFAVTVALPFFALALVPGGMRLLPRSGSWFSVFKVVLAFVELGFAVKFFRGAELQWDWLNLLSREVTLGLWVALAAAAAVYLVGFFPLRFPHDPKLRPPTARRAGWASLFLLLGVYFGYGAAGNELVAGVEAFVLPDPERGDEEGSIRFGLSYRTDLASLEAAKARAAASGAPVFLMFTGHNCVNCVQMEKGVLPLPSVTARLGRVERVALFIDKASDPAEQRHKELMLGTYNDSGAIPAFFLIDGAGAVRAGQIGLASEQAFLEFLAAGGLD